MSVSQPVLQNPIAAIKARSSVRTYTGAALTEGQKSGFTGYMDGQVSVFPNPVRFALVDLLTLAQPNLKLGTYGVIKGANTYVISALVPGPYDMESLGYLLEKGILYAAEEGLGTCWLGGTFVKEDFAKLMSLSEAERIHAVTPIGFGTEKRRLLDNTMRALVGATKRKAFETLFFQGAYGTPFKVGPAPSEGDQKLGQALEMVRIGPSASNKQPWRVVVVPSSEGPQNTTYACHFYLEHTKGYPESAQRIDMGIAACHMELASTQLGLKGAFAFEKPPLKTPDQVDYSFSWICQLT